MTDNIYEQPLSRLINISFLPEKLNVIDEATNSIFNQLLFKNYISKKLDEGGEGFYNLDIVIPKELGLDIPGTGMFLLVNPSYDGTQNVSVFNISIYYRWLILKYIENFEISSFSFDKKGMIGLIKNIIDLEESIILESIANTTLNYNSQEFDIIQLIGSFNSEFQLYNTPNELVYNSSTTVFDILDSLALIPITINDLINKFEPITDYPLGNDTAADVLVKIGTIGGTVGSNISQFINSLNDTFELKGSSNEIHYISNPATTYEDVLIALNTAGISIDQVLITYLFNSDNSSFKDLQSSIIDFFTVLNNNYYPQDLIDSFVPSITTSINDITLAIEFPRTVLKPINPNTNEVIEDENIKSQLLFNVGSLSFNTDSGFEFENLSEFSFRKSEITNTGITIDFSGAKIDLSKNTNIPEATAAGYPNDFVGVFVESATIGLPAFWQKDSSRSNAEIYGENLLIGTGGISGTVGLRALDPNSGVAPLLHTKFGPDGKGFEITLDNFDLTFRQNAIISSDINGRLILPKKFKPVNGSGQPVNGELVIGVNISIDRDGFAVTAKPLGQPLTFNISDVANFTINSLQVGKEEDRFYIDASGKIKIVYDQAPLNSFLPQAIDIQRLRIWSDGQIEFRGTGGEFKLRKPISLRFPPVEMSVTAIHLGSYEGYHNGVPRKYMYFGFDGTLSLNPGGIDGKGSGVKFYFTQDNDPEENRPRHVFMRIETLEIDLILPEKNPGLTLQGILSMRDPEPTSAIPDPGPEYIGSVTFELNKLKMSGSAGMRLTPRVPAFIVDAALELSTPIVLGATGLGIYGFRGLIGMNYVASKTAIGLDADARWYDYYKKKVPPINREGVDIGKFDLHKKGFSFGAGVSLATAADQGRAFSSKLFLLLSLPGAFLLQGQAQVVKKQRLQLTDPYDPPFSLMLAVDDSSFSVTIGVNFVMPNDSSESPGDKGSILDAFGEFDFAFFWKDASAWYMNLGTEERPIRAEVLKLFRSYAYLMVSGRGIRFGAGAGFDKSVIAGPMKIRLWSQLDIGARISFKPIQFGGFIALVGGVEVKVFGFGFGLSVQAGLAGEAPKPFIVTGHLEVCVRVLNKNRCAGIELTWEFKKEKDTTPAVLINEVLGVSQVAKAVNMLTGEGFSVLSVPLGNNSTLPNINNVNLDNFVIPVDSFIDIEFSKGMRGSNALGNKVGGDRGGISEEFVPPVRGKSARVLHSYSLEDLEIFCHDGTQWKSYNIYDALTPWDNADFIKTTDTSTYPIAYWQLDNPLQKNKLSIMAMHPLTFLRPANVVYEELGVSVENLLCVQNLKEVTCVYVKSPALGVFKRNKWTALQSGVKARLIGQNGKVIQFPNLFEAEKALQVFPGSILSVVLPDPSALVRLKLSAFSESVKVSYYSNSLITAKPVKEELVPTEALMDEVVYEDLNRPIVRIDITPGACPVLNEETTSCSTPLPEAALLLTTLNNMTSGGGLVNGDPFNGTRLYLNKNIQSMYLPSGYTSAKLQLQMSEYKKRRWTFVINRTLNPGVTRTGTLKIGSTLTPFVLPGFDTYVPVNDTSVLITAMSQIFLASKKLTIVSTTANSITIEAINPSTELVEIPTTNAFIGYLTPDSGKVFNYTQVVSFSNLKPDASRRTDGLNYTFTVEATLSNSSVILLTGSTDTFPIVCCNGVTSRYVSETCKTATLKLQDLQKYRDVLLAEKAKEQKLCVTLYHKI